MDDLENFRAVVAQSDLLRERWLTVTSKIIAECDGKFGESIDREALMKLNSVRLAVLTGDEFDWRAEAQQQLPTLKRATEVAEIKRRIEEEDAQAVIEKEFDGLSPTERMGKARELGLGEKVERLKLTPEEQAREIARINSMRLSPAQKMAEGRKAGLKL